MGLLDQIGLRSVLGSSLSTERGAYHNRIVSLSGNYTEDDGGAGFARWDENNTSTEDGAYVWGSGLPGRWVRSSVGGGDYASVADITARDAIPAGSRSAGMVVWIQDTFQSFRLGPGLTNADWRELEPRVIRAWEEPGWYPDNNTDSSDGWNTLFADTTKVRPGTTVLLGPYSYHFTSRLKLDGTSRTGLYGFRIVGANATQGGTPIGVTILRGVVTEPNRAFITWGVTQCSLEKTLIFLDGGNVRSLIRYGKESATYLGSALSSLIGEYDTERVRVSGWTSVSDGGEGHAEWDADSTATEDALDVWGSGAPGRWIRTDSGTLGANWAKSWNRFIDVGFVHGTKAWSFEFDDLAGGANLENTTFENCRFDVGSNSQGAVYFGYWGQPYSTIFRGCSFFGGSNEIPHGTGIHVDNFSTGVWCYGCDFQQLETGIRMNDSANVAVFGGQFEHIQYVAEIDGTGVGANIAIHGARISLTLGAASDGPIVRPAGQGVYARSSGYGTITFSQCNIGSLGLGEDYYALVGGYGKVVWRDCSLPGGEVIRTIPTVTNHIGCGAVTESCTITSATIGGSPVAAPDYRGRLNPDGFVTVTGANTTRTVTFNIPEPDDDYQIELAFRTSSGGASAGSSIGRVTAQTVNGFTITVDAAPGAGPPAESATFGYRVIPSYTTVPDPAGVGGLAYRWDASSGVTGTAPVTAWADTVSGSNLVSSTGAPALTAANANVNGLPTVDFAPGDELVSSAAASTWAFLNDLNGDNGFTLIEVLYIPSGASDSEYHIGTRKTIGSLGRGMGIRLVDAASMRINFADGATQADWAAAGWVHGKAYFAVRARQYGDAGMGVVIPTHSANEAPPPPTGDRARIIGDPALTFAVRCGYAAHTVSVAEILIYNRALPSHEIRAIVETYLRPKYGDL